MINEHVYCPRLCALEWLNGEWADSADTVEGKTVHRRVDAPTRGRLPEPEDIDPERPLAVRRVELSDPALQMLARIDLVEVNEGEVAPIEYKKSVAPDIPLRAWDPERVQVCVQALLLRAHGYTVTRGFLWFAGSRTRVEVPITEELVALTLQHRDGALALTTAGRLPPPLIDSPRCVGCSLVGICLPDEQNHLAGAGAAEVRPLIPARKDGLPLHVTSFRAYLKKKDEEIIAMEKDEELARARINDTSAVILYGPVSITTPLMNELASRDIPISFHSTGGWYQGSFTRAGGHNIFGRIAQHRVAADPAACLALAKSFVRSKIANCRVLMRRNAEELPETVLIRMKEMGAEVDRVDNAASLLGVEGSAARLYFEHLPLMIQGTDFAFDFQGRNRRPPRDPVNCMLSFAYACLVREFEDAIRVVGLDACVGFYHRPRPGKPALALDLMEEMRPVICDSVVLNAINNEVVRPDDFEVTRFGCAFKREGKKRFLEVWERRLDELATHPTFGSRLSYRRILEVQTRLLGKVLMGDLDRYPEYRIR